jgi:hypothetical protein
MLQGLDHPRNPRKKSYNTDNTQKNADLLNSTIDQSTILDGESLSPQRMKHLNMNNQSQ